MATAVCGSPGALSSGLISRWRNNQRYIGTVAAEDTRLRVLTIALSKNRQDRQRKD